MESKVARAWPARAAGLRESQRAAAAKLFDYKLEPLMRESNVDYTLVFRQLAECLKLPDDASDDDLLEPLAPAFYDSPNAFYDDEHQGQVVRLRPRVEGRGGRDGPHDRGDEQGESGVRAARVDARRRHSAAKENDDFSVLEELFELDEDAVRARERRDARSTTGARRTGR